MRQIGSCMNCGKERALVAHSLCAKCYMQGWRAEEKNSEPSWIGPDQTQHKSQKELNRMRVNFAKMVSLLDDSPTSNIVLPPDEHALIKGLLIAAIDKINQMQGLQEL